MRASPAITSFNAGELSPLMAGRPDLEKWQAGLSLCQNLIPKVQGALERAAGTVFVGAVKDATDRTWLVPFIYSQSDAFVLEFGDGYIRFYRSRGRLTTGSVTAWSSLTAYAVGDMASLAGVTYYAKAASTNQTPPNTTYWYPMTGDTYEIPSPYAVADLTRADGSCALRFEQSGDVVYIACEGYQPRTLTRLGNVQWVLEAFEPEGGPFKDQNLDEDITVTVTEISSGGYDVGASVTVEASEDIFTAAMVGSLIEVELLDGADVKAWQARTSTDVGDVRRSDFKFYECTQVGPVDTTDKPAICGESIPVHTRGKYWDGTGEEQKGDGNVGSIGVEWEYLHAGYGWGRITTFTSATEVVVEVLSRFPEELATEASHRWSLGAWSAVEGWPDNVCFFRERLSWFRGQQVWQSVAGDFRNFRARTHGEVLPDSAVAISIQSARGNPIEWVTPTRDVLFLGTAGGEHTLKQQTTQQPYGPGNTQQDPETEWGGIGVEPLVVGAGPVFADKSGRRLRIIVPGDSGYEALDLNKYHGLLPSPIVSMAWQQTPHEVVWCALANGALRAMTLQTEDKVIAWARHDVAGEVESVAVIPSPDGTRDDVWMIVKREIDGGDVRYVEYRAAEYEDGDDQALSVYFASALTYSGSSTSTLSGLDHLEGETVGVKTGGAAHPDRVVTGGEIELQAAATKAVVGLPMEYKGVLMPIEAGGSQGTAQGKVKRIDKVNVRLLNTLGGLFGASLTNTDPLQYRLAGTDMDAPPPLYTGDIEATFRGDSSRAATVAFTGSDGFPFTLIALFPELTTND